MGITGLTKWAIMQGALTVPTVLNHLKWKQIYRKKKHPPKDPKAKRNERFSQVSFSEWDVSFRIQMLQVLLTIKTKFLRSVLPLALS